MKKNKKVDAVRVFNHAAVVLEDAAHDFDDSMQCLRSTLLEVHFAAQDRGESVAALEREADAFRDDEKLRRFFVSAAVDARNGFDLDAEVAEGTEAAARCAQNARWAHRPRHGSHPSPRSRSACPHRRADRRRWDKKPCRKARPAKDSLFREQLRRKPPAR